MDHSPAQEIGPHVPRMYRVALRMLADADRAKDVVQDACVKALAGLYAFNGDAQIATWLHRITVNCATDAMRSQSRREAARQKVGAFSDGDGPGVAASPAELVETRELADLAWRMLGQLPDDCRSAFALTQLDGYSYDEAAEIEGEARGTIASRVYRAKKLLLERMNARIDGRATS